MKLQLPPTYMTEIQHYGAVGTGKVVAFAPKNTKVLVALPRSSAAYSEAYGVATACGPSLNEEGVHDGDLLIFCRQFTIEDVTPETVCIVFIEPTGELVAKKVIFDQASDQVILRSSGGGIEDVYYQPDEIEIRAVVTDFQRRMRSRRKR